MTPYYQDDLVTILHGDCRELMGPDDDFDLMLTDPPYGIGRDGASPSTGGHGSSAANIYTPAASTILTTIRHIRVSNKTGTAATYTLYVGATGGSAGGTEITGLSESVAANSHADQYFSPGLLMASTDFLTGLASAGNTLTIVVMGEQSVV